MTKFEQRTSGLRIELSNVICYLNRPLESFISSTVCTTISLVTPRVQILQANLQKLISGLMSFDKEFSQLRTAAKINF